MSNKIIEIKDLQQGDILLFSALTDDIESKLIALITNSPVSHSAMSYYTFKEIVEETPPQAQVNQIMDRVVDRDITVMRLKKTNMDMSKVLNIAKGYVDRKEPYPKANLLFVGLYILLKRAMISSKMQRLLCGFMKYILGDLIELIDNNYYPNTHPMVCSQFIYRCYEEAGKDYKLIIEDVSSPKCLLETVQTYIDDNKSEIESKLCDSLKDIKVDNKIPVTDTNQILEEMYNELVAINDTNPTNSSDFLEEEFVLTVHEFVSVVNGYIHKNPDLDLLKKEGDLLKSKSIEEVLDKEEFFVTPGDLLINCSNLINIGALSK